MLIHRSWCRKEQAARNHSPHLLVPALNDLLSEHGLSIHQGSDGAPMMIRPAVAGLVLVPEASRHQGSGELQRAASPSGRSDCLAGNRIPAMTHSPLPERAIPPVDEPTPVRFVYDTPVQISRGSASAFDAMPPQESHGTLVLGKSGRSRYLGHTAGPEWLKHVCEQWAT